MTKVKPWKKMIGDRGYNGANVSTPNPMDSKELAKFKSRARLRHETFNSRLKCYQILSNRFRHSRAHHQAVFEAICVTAQYTMDNGSPIFDV